MAAAYTLGTTAIGNSAQVTSADNGKTVTATLTVTFPYGTNEQGSPAVNVNSAQGDTAVLNDIAVSLVQNNPNA